MSPAETLSHWIRSLSYLAAASGLFALMSGALENSLHPPLALLMLAVFARFEAQLPSDWLRAHRTQLVLVLAALGALGAFAGFGTLNSLFAVVCWLQLLVTLSHAELTGPFRVASVALLHLIAGALVPAGLGYAGAFLLFCGVLPPLLLLAHLRLRQTREQATHSLPVGVLRRWTRLSAALSLPLLLFTFATFLLFPRVGHGFLPLGLKREQASTGLSENPTVGETLEILKDAAVVARITPPQRAQPRPLRLRALAHDTFTAGRWHRALRRERRLFVNAHTYRVRRWPDPARDQAYTVLLEALELPVVPQLPATVALRLEDSRQPLVRRTLPLLQRRGREIRYRGRPRGLHYTLWVDPELQDASLPARLSEQDREAYLGVDPLYAPLVEEARRRFGKLPDTEARVLAMLHWFRESGEFRYALDALPQGQDALMRFVLKERRGHCELFASSMAMMLRGLGVPTRYITGFAGGQWNPYGGYVALRKADAHAWIEAFVGNRWIRLDPTPGRGQTASAPAQLLDRLRAMVDAMQARWRSYVLEHDAARQWGWLRSLGQGLRGVERGYEQAAKASPERGAVLKRLGSYALGILAGVVMLALLLLRRRPTQRGRRALRQLDRAFRKRRMRRPRHRAPVSHLAELEATQGRDPELTQLLRAYEQQRFGRAQQPPQPRG